MEEEIFKEFKFNIDNISKEMEIENMDVSRENINNLEKVEQGIITIDDLIKNIKNNALNN